MRATRGVAGSPCVRLAPSASTSAIGSMSHSMFSASYQEWKNARATSVSTIGTIRPKRGARPQRRNAGTSIAAIQARPLSGGSGPDISWRPIIASETANA